MKNKYSKQRFAVIRRKNTIKRLEAQLAAGTKTGKKSTEAQPLEEDDKKRIGLEITVLQTRL